MAELPVRTHRLKIILIAASILALGAGVFAGMAVSRLPSGGAPIQTVVAEHLSIADELQLTDLQRDQLRSIWEGVRNNVHQSFDEAQEIQKERDAAVFAMLSDSQKARYAALTQQAAEQFAKLNTQRQQAFHQGVDQTKKILNDAQRKTYDRIIQNRLGTSSDAVNTNNGSGAGGGGVAVPTTDPVSRDPVSR
jgi:Spy/CpxP family protein refolding chaperone